MASDSVFETMARCGVVPVLAIDSADWAIPLADALLEGGLPIAEVTFRTAAAAEVIEIIASKRPELLVGAGTVITSENLQAAERCGAKFGVAPGLNPAIVAEAESLDMPFIPGIATASEIEQGLALDCRVLKFFPAEPNGGVEMIKALSAPYAHTKVQFMPTGGVNPGNLETYLALNTVVAVGGTWIAKKEDMAASKWQEIRDRCRKAVELVRRIRGK